MNDLYIVYVIQKDGAEVHVLKFVFNAMADAMEFAGTCLECGEDGTGVNIRRSEEE